MVGRLGCGDFAILVPGGLTRGHEAASAVLRRVAKAFAGEHGPSVGVSSPSGDADSFSPVLSHADEALDEA